MFIKSSRDKGIKMIFGIVETSLIEQVYQMSLVC
jgi:hypothetical protein